METYIRDSYTCAAKGVLMGSIPGRDVTMFYIRDDYTCAAKCVLMSSLPGRDVTGLPRTEGYITILVVYVKALCDTGFYTVTHRRPAWLEESCLLLFSH